MTVYAIGIDPGLDGAIVTLLDGKVDAAYRFSRILKKRKGGLWDPRDVCAALSLAARPPGWTDTVSLALEMSQAARTPAGRAGRGSHALGARWGVLWAVALDVFAPDVSAIVPAHKWIRDMCPGPPEEGKQRAIALVRRELPGLDLTPGRVRNPHTGLADAGAIALWAHAQAR